MTRRRLGLTASAVLAGGLLVLVAGREAGRPSLGLVLDCRFQSQGKLRTLKVRNAEGAIVVPPGAEVWLATHLKSAAMGHWRKVGCTRDWSSDWASGPKGPGAGTVSFVAPQRPGTHCVEHVARVEWRRDGKWPPLCRRADSTARTRLFVLVPVPGDELRDGKVRGYELGEYPEGTEPPAEFVEITKRCAKAFVSPHYCLALFASAGHGYPKYAPFSYPLVDKLEAVSDALRAKGHLRGALRVYSVYRTPEYNAEVCGASRSQHMWGRAADVIVDERPRDGRMDDLNADGKVDMEDAKVIGSTVRRLERQGTVVRGGTGVYEFARRLGGYGANAHVDVRGWQAKWARHYHTPGDMTHCRELSWGG